MTRKTFFGWRKFSFVSKTTDITLYESAKSKTQTWFILPYQFSLINIFCPEVKRLWLYQIKYSTGTQDICNYKLWEWSIDHKNKQRIRTWTQKPSGVFHELQPWGWRLYYYYIITSIPHAKHTCSWYSGWDWKCTKVVYIAGNCNLKWNIQNPQCVLSLCRKKL